MKKKFPFFFILFLIFTTILSCEQVNLSPDTNSNQLDSNVEFRAPCDQGTGVWSTLAGSTGSPPTGKLNNRLSCWGSIQMPNCGIGWTEITFADSDASTFCDGISACISLCSTTTPTTTNVTDAQQIQIINYAANYGRAHSPNHNDCPEQLTLSWMEFYRTVNGSTHQLRVRYFWSCCECECSPNPCIDPPCEM